MLGWISEKLCSSPKKNLRDKGTIAVRSARWTGRLRKGGMRQKTLDFFYACRYLVYKWKAGDKDRMESSPGVDFRTKSPFSFRLCITSQGVDDRQPKGRQMRKDIVSIWKMDPLILFRRPRLSFLYSTYTICYSTSLVTPELGYSSIQEPES